MTARGHRRFLQSRPPIDRLISPFREFTESSVSGGILLMVAAAVALVWANSPLAASYDDLVHTPISIGIGAWSFSESLHFWINDVLMAVFFLLVGLEIKREVLVGELASARTALLPIAAAAGGAILPAIIFLALAGGSPEARPGWGIPMATDIAFALGVLALLGSRIPLGLRLFLAALAIVDDLLAVLVIALFYTAELSVLALAASGAIILVLVGANRLGVRRPMVYGLLGIALWITVHASGIHATVAGVVLALTIPARRRLDTPEYIARARALLDHLHDRVSRAEEPEGGHYGELTELEDVTEKAQAPMLRIEHGLHPWVAFLIVPLFALANAGVPIARDPLAIATDPIVLGVVVGLIVGKAVGITTATWVVVRLGIADLPAGVTWAQIVGVAALGGIGFTMSLFIAELAYGAGPQLDLAKQGILIASVVAALAGMFLLRRATRAGVRRPEQGVPG